MAERHLIQINNDLYKDIQAFCKMNSLKIADFINEMIEKQFLVEKYGDISFGTINHSSNRKISQIETENGLNVVCEEPEKEVKETPVEVDRNITNSPQENEPNGEIESPVYDKPVIPQKPKRRKL